MVKVCRCYDCNEEGSLAEEAGSGGGTPGAGGQADDANAGIRDQPGANVMMEVRYVQTNLIHCREAQDLF